MMVAFKQTDYIKYQKKIFFYLNLDLLIPDDFLLHTITGMNGRSKTFLKSWKNAAKYHDA